ncbi:MAG: S-layer protein [Rhodopirellula sp.]|nr:S-layer protein [Rhodopirellula sp.]
MFFQSIRFSYPSLQVLFWVLAMIAPVSVAADGIRLLPTEFLLSGSENIQQLTVVHLVDGELAGMVDAAGLHFTVSDPAIVEVKDGVAHGLANGTAAITVEMADGSVAVTQVRVANVQNMPEWSFRNHVQSVIAKTGCNMGACHGALAGKGGFKLSLRGYDTDADYMSITQKARGRRIELSDPGRSLLVAKPTGALPHKGGLKLAVGSRDYQVLADWIAAGAKGPADTDPQLERISVTPEAALLRPGDQFQILVNAHYSDGQTVDVTHWAQFSATDEAIATVDTSGVLKVQGSGEAAVLVWFGSKVALARMTVPYPNHVPAEIYQRAERRNFIDELNLTQLKTLQLRPSPLCDDLTFLRRATLDTVGRLPTPDERSTYLAADEKNRRDELVERLLAGEDFIAYWTYRWSDMLLINGTRLRPVAVKTYYQWVENAVRKNQPWDQMVREILTATGNSDQNGATNFYALHQAPEDMTENACQAFLGLSIGCAKCHNHPLEKWTNDQYYAMANLFSRVRAKGWGGDGRNGDGIRTLFVANTGELIQPNLGRAQQPAPLDAPPLDFDDPRDRRVALADWMTKPENPYFSRSIANRVWANFFGRGLVEQVDDLRLSNPASNEALLNAAAKHVVDAGFNLKELMRTILRSKTYQRSSLPLVENRDEFKYLSRYYPRRLMAEVLLDGIDQVLQTTTAFTELAFPGADKQKTDFYKSGTRAIQLYDASVNSYFLKTFGRNPREITCECERSAEPSLVQVLHLSNGETLNPKLADQKNRIARLIDANESDAAIVQNLFVAALSREATESELGKLLEIRGEYGDDRATALQDIAWSILTSAEFTFNH